MKVHISFEQPRGCGYRKPGKDGVGIYLRGSPFNEACERLPWLLDVCPVCGGGIKPTRGFTWINPMSLFDPYVEPCCTAILEDAVPDGHQHDRCWMCNPELLGSKAGLIWVGEKHYPTAQDFLREAEIMGISRKIPAVPHGFEVGIHAIFLAHRKAIWRTSEEGTKTYLAGVFAAFKPTHIDLVIDDENKVPDRALELVKRIGRENCQLIKVVPDKPEDAIEDAWSDWEEA